VGQDKGNVVFLDLAFFRLGHSIKHKFSWFCSN
jgi:hypothetical protein